MRVQNGSTDHRPFNMGMYASTKAKTDSEDKYEEGRRKLDLIQLRPREQLHKMVPNICEF